ncbi:MAG: TolC family protein [Proteobacteria bacterium]|nr:TolC family protein [Pseudomonadota bacterium]
MPLSAAALLTACAGAAPPAALPPVISADWSRPASAPPATNIDLATALASPELADLIARARKNSPNLQIATARVDQARAALRAAHGAYLPAVSIGASLAASNGSGSRYDIVKNIGTIDATLSIDPTAGATSAAQAGRLAASQFDRRAAGLALDASVARSYVAALALRARLELIEGSIRQATEIQRIVELRAREGAATMVEVGLQRIRRQQLAIERERLLQGLEQNRASLALLVGEEAPGFVLPAGQFGTLALPEPGLPAPSALIALRPDVRAAEAQIAAAGGDVVAARAAFYPRIDLSLQRSAQSALTSSALSGITLGAELLAPIFARGRLGANLDMARARQREVVQSYRQVLLSALAEVEQGLAAVEFSRNRGALLAGNVADARAAAAAAHRQYLEGEADLQHLFDAEDLVVTTQDAAVLNRQERLEAAILLLVAGAS